MRIVAVDLGKSKSVACVYDSSSGDHSFETIPTDAKALVGRLTAWAPDRVVIEICPLAGWVGDLVREKGIELEVANPTHDAWRWKNVKRKTDRDDALKLARLSAMNQLPTVYLPARRTRQWRSLIAYRQSLVARRTRIKNRIRAILSSEGKRMPAGRSGWSARAMNSLYEMACPLNEVENASLWCGELFLELDQYSFVNQAIGEVEWKLNEMGKADHRVERLVSIPGVGARLAETVVSVIDDPHRFRNAKQVGAYVGLTPRQYQSGSRDRQGRISGQGNKLLRSMLVEVSWLGLQHNSWMREVYQRVCRETKARKKIAIVAVARRLLIRCWAVLRDEGRWNPPPMDATKAAA